MARVYYNEFDKQKAAWLRELIQAGHIAPGDVDERSIADVRPSDLDGYTQCHFFAGIGIWSYALRLAGWPDDRPVWTGSCPCQPFSDAGKGEAFNDPRHLWPVWFLLIEARRPFVCLGEQVASIDGLAWLDLVQSDLDNAGYTCGAVDICAAGLGAPHRRQRLFWVADSGSERRQQDSRSAPENEAADGRARRDEPHGDYKPSGGVATGELDNPAEARRAGNGKSGTNGALRDGARVRESSGRSASGELDDGNPGPLNGFWRASDWIFCRDGKWRPVEAGTFPLAHGTPARVGRLRGYGDGIVAQAAAAFIGAYMQERGIIR